MFVVTVMMLLMTSSVQGQTTGPEPPPLNFTLGVLANSGIPTAILQWNGTAKWLSENSLKYLGRRVNFEFFPCLYDVMAQNVAAGQMQFTIANPAVYLRLAQDHGAFALATLKNSVNGKPMAIYGGVVITAANAPPEYDDLKIIPSKKISAVTIDGFASTQCQQCLLNVVDLSGFANINFTGTQIQPIDDVLTGKSDIGFVRTGYVEKYIIDKKASDLLSRIRVINPQPLTDEFPFVRSTPFYSEWAFSAIPGNSSLLDLDRFVLMLLQLPSDSYAAKWGGYVGWGYARSYTTVQSCLKSLGFLDTEYEKCLKKCVHGECTFTFSQNASSCICERGYNGTWCNSFADYELQNVQYDSAIGKAIAVVTAILITVILLYMGLVIGHKDHTAIKATSPKFLLAILIGCVVALIDIYFWIGQPTVALCVLRPFFLGIAIILIFGSLFTKSYRIWRLFSSAHQMRVVALTDLQLFGQIGALMVPMLVIHIVWFAMGVETRIQRSSKEVWKAEDKCIFTNDGIFIGLLVGYYGLFMVVGCYLLFLVRNLVERYNESKFITLIMYNFSFCGMTGFLILTLLDLDIQQKTIIFSAFVMVIAIFSSSILIIPKIVAIYNIKSASSSAGSVRGEKGDRFSTGSINTNHSNERGKV